MDFTRCSDPTEMGTRLGGLCNPDYPDKVFLPTKPLEVSERKITRFYFCWKFAKSQFSACEKTITTWENLLIWGGWQGVIILWSTSSPLYRKAEAHGLVQNCPVLNCPDLSARSNWNSWPGLKSSLGHVPPQEKKKSLRLVTLHISRQEMCWGNSRGTGKHDGYWVHTQLSWGVGHLAQEWTGCCFFSS